MYFHVGALAYIISYFKSNAYVIFDISLLAIFEILNSIL
jgi:hypothetical protein